jgi:hypothetical protein
LIFFFFFFFLLKKKESGLDEGVVDPAIGGIAFVNHGKWHTMAESAIVTSSGVKGQIQVSGHQSLNKAKEGLTYTTSTCT